MREDANRESRTAAAAGSPTQPVEAQCQRF